MCYRDAIFKKQILQKSFCKIFVQWTYKNSLEYMLQESSAWTSKMLEAK